MSDTKWRKLFAVLADFPLKHKTHAFQGEYVAMESGLAFGAPERPPETASRDAL